MKYVFSFLIFLPLFITAQTTPSCCSLNSPTGEFAALANSEDFRNTHQEPIASSDTDQDDDAGEMISFKTPDGKTADAFQILSPYAGRNYLFVFHEWWGLNEQIKDWCQKLHSEMPDVNIIALDLYDGKVATTREAAAELMQGADEARIRAIINGAMGHIPPKADIATIGWCFGGGWSLQAAIMAEDKLKLCVMYYGMPETDIAKLKTLNAPVIGFFASKDQWINAEVVTAFEANMKKAGKTLATKTYEAEHAFANPSNPIYDKEAASDAYKSVKKYLAKYFFLSD